MIKVLHIGKFYPPHVGGMEYYLYDLNRELNRRGVRSDVLCSGEAPFSVSERTGKSEIFRSGTMGIVASTPISPAMIWQTMRICREYDIVHVHLPNPMSNLALFISGTKAKIIIQWQSDIVKQKRLIKLYHPLLMWLLNRADSLIASSESYVGGSFYLKRFRDKVTVIPLGMDRGRMREPNSSVVLGLREKYQGKKVVFALGRLTYYKGFEYLIKAARLLPDNLVVIIAGKGGLLNSLQREIEESGVSEKVVILGGLSEEDLAAYFKICEVFVLPSVARSEAFGIAQLEAMYYGKPVISTNIPHSGVSWVNLEGISGLIVKPRDPAALAEAIMRICGDAALREKLSVGARRRVHDEFSISVIAQKMIALYSKVLGES